MNNELQVFNYEGRNVRTVEIDGEAWFVGKDVADILGYKKTRNAIRYHVDDEDKMLLSNLAEPCFGAPSNDGYANLVIINESGLYSLILSSKLPTAKKFKHWVTHEVLPSIRKSGIYMTEDAANAYMYNPEVFKQMAEKCSTLEHKISELEKHIDNTKSITVLGQVVLAQKGSIPFKDGANFLCQHGIDIGQNRLFKWCRDKKLLCSRKGRQWNKPTQKAIEAGLFNLEINGGFNSITMITPAGLQYLADEFMSENYPLLVLLHQ